MGDPGVVAREARGIRGSVWHRVHCLRNQGQAFALSAGDDRLPKDARPVHGNEENGDL